MFYLSSPSTDPYFNLALEEHVFSHLDRTKSWFLLWQNERTIVVGKYQNTAAEIDRAFVESRGIRVVRRLSGGGAVYHDLGNLNFTFIVDRQGQEAFNFRVFTQPVIRALASFGVQAAFTGRNDLVIGGKKFSGNSQYVRNGRVLHHGCIMLDSNLEDVSAALKAGPDKFRSKGVQSVRSRVTTINAHAPSPISMGDFRAALLREVAAAEPLEPYTLTQEDLEEVERLRRDRYAAWAWNYGASPPYDVERTERFPGGQVTARVQVERGAIRSVRFSGDFFGEDVEALEKALEGLPLDSSLEGALERLDVGRYLKGISAGELRRLLAG